MTVIAYTVLYLLAFICGAALASFGNVLICRLPRGLDFRRGRSQCPACGHVLAARDLVPIFSRLLLRARCRYCAAPISFRYTLVEIIGGLLAMAACAVYGFTWLALSVFAFLFILLVLAVIDLDTMEIPDGLLLALLIPAAALVFLLPNVTPLQHAIGFLAVSLPLFLITLAIPGAFGGGDIKLMAVAGLALGWQLILVAFFFGLLLGGGYGAWLLMTKKAGRKGHFAFGPFLALGLALALLAGRPLLAWYLSLMF